MIQHSLCSACPLLCRLEYEEHIIRKLLPCAAEIMHSAEHRRRVSVVTAKVLRPLLSKQRVYVSPESYGLIAARIEVIYRSGVHAEVYVFYGITTAYLFDVCGRLMFFKCTFRYRMQILPVLLGHCYGLVHYCFVHTIKIYTSAVAVIAASQTLEARWSEARAESVL